MSILFDYEVMEKVYKDVGYRKLNLYIFEPNNEAEDRAVILFFHGGSFSKSGTTPARFQHQANHFRSQGMVAICVDYRTASDDFFSPEQAISDAKSAIQWVRVNYKELKINPNRVVFCGASSGGYTCLSSVMIDQFNDGEDSSISHIPNALVIFNAGVDGVDIMTRIFPELLSKADVLSPLNFIKSGIPPMIWMVGDEDIIYDSNKQFCELLKKQKNYVEFITYQGMNHGFFNYGLHDNVPFNDTNQRIEKFLRKFELI